MHTPPSEHDRSPSCGSSHDPASELCEAMAAIHRRGWCEGTGGNFSCVVGRTPLRLLMAPSGVDKGSVRPDALLLVNNNGEVLRGQGKASAETMLHLAIVETTGAGAVLHTHSQAGTLLSRHYGPQAGPANGPAHGQGQQQAQAAEAEQGQASEGEAGVGEGKEGAVTEGAVTFVELRDLEMLKGLEGIRTHATSVRIPVLANDQNLIRLSHALRPHLASAPHGLLIAGHGLYAWGTDLPQAKRHLEVLEFLLEQRWRELLLEAISGVGGKA